MDGWNSAYETGKTQAIWLTDSFHAWKEYNIYFVWSL